MSNINTTTPNFVFGYWRPWNENSNFIESYLDYIKDKSLIDYASQSIGKYIEMSSNNTVNAINDLGKTISGGFKVISKNLNEINNQLSTVNLNLNFINKNLELQIEQSIVSNILLEHIIDLLKIPDSEKERQHCIELGIKFFINAKNDSDLFADSLEEFLKAEALMKQDYFVLHKIGCIYLYSEKLLNPEKALDYFTRAAKYASVETNQNAIRSYNALTFNFDNKKVKSIEKELKLYEENFDFDDFPALQETYNGWYFEDFTYKLYTVENYIDDGYDCNEDDKIYFDKLISDDSTDELLKNELITIKKYFDDVFEKYGYINNNLNSINAIAADAYQKAAFASYILGQFEKAVNYQSKSIKYYYSAENLFLLSKYQIRGNQVMEAIKNLEKSIELNPKLAIGVFKEIDLMNEPKVLELIDLKNKEIDFKINNLIRTWEKAESTNSNLVLKQLNELKNKSYDTKINEYLTLTEAAELVNKLIIKQENYIDDLIKEVNSICFCTLDKTSIVNELIKTKDLPAETMHEKIEEIKNLIVNDALGIGSKFAGGIVFYFDQITQRGLACADKDFGKAVWGGKGTISANEDGIADGSGMRNTKKIVDHASWFIKKGFFSTTKSPAPTAARLCLESNHNGFSDWYLPTKSELELMFKTLKNNNIGNFQNANYWSSSEFNGNHISSEDSVDPFNKAFYTDIWAYIFKNQEEKNLHDRIWNKKGERGIEEKKELHHVRGIRIFKLI